MEFLITRSQKNFAQSQVIVREIKEVKRRAITEGTQPCQTERPYTKNIHFLRKHKKISILFPLIVFLIKSLD